MEEVNKEDNKQTIKEFNEKHDILTDIELRTAEIKDPAPVIEGMLFKKSVTVLAGNPKARKSFMALEQALSVTSGEPFLNQYNTTCGNAFMISLEDSKIRINKRLNTLAYKASGKFLFTTKVLKIKELEEFLILYGKHKIDLLIIDTYSKFFGCDFKDSYKGHYENITKLKELAEEYDIAILIIHHTTKKINEDWTQNLLGSQGITGAVDTIMYLDRKRGSDEGILYITGRDVEEQSINITFSKQNCRWIKSKSKLQKDDNIQLSPEREELYKILRDRKEPMQLKDIADKVGKATTSVQNLLKKLSDNNLVKIVKTGFYQVQDRKQVDSMEVVEDEFEIESMDTMEHEFQMESVEVMDSMEANEMELSYI